MKFEVLEDTAAWIVRRDGVELARFGDQEQALADVARRLRGAADADLSYSLAVRYLVRG
jgi:hypothetical protein